MHALATRFGTLSGYANALSPLSNEQILRAAPSIFADAAHESRSERYTYIPTIEVLNGLRKEGFEPFMVCQARTRIEGRQDHTRHMIRLRHASRIAGEEAPEIVMVNSHDGSSSYQMLAGVYRFVCQNGLVCGDTVEDFRVPHRGNVVERVIEGAYRVLEQFEQVEAEKDGMKAITLSEGEQTAFAKSALALRFDPAEEGQGLPITERQVLAPHRREDVDGNLWTTLNVVQENLVRGGLRTLTANGRRTRTRAVQGIDQNVKLNRSLWILAEEMKKLKAA